MGRVKVEESARVEVLLDWLAQRLEAAPIADPFRPELLAIPSRAVRELVEYGLAERLGVCANVSFPFAGEALARVLCMLEGRAWAARDPWSGDSLVWTVLTCLREALAEQPASGPFAPVVRWLGADGSIEDTAIERRLWGLAEDVAKLFERYIHHRPEMVLAWEAGCELDGAGRPAEAEIRWQIDLFLRVAARLGPDAPHLARRLTTLTGAVIRPPDGGWPIERLTIFAVSALPPLFLDALKFAAGHIDIDMLLLAPSEAWIGDMRPRTEPVDDAHPLLLTFGQSAMVLQRACIEHDIAIGGRPTTTHEESRSLLGALHDGIRRNIAPDRDPVLREAGAIVEPFLEQKLHGSSSVEIHSCPGDVRQAEVLRDVILRRLAVDPSLEPRDITVVVPDVSAWYPLISAVLEEGRVAGSHKGPPAIPWRVTDVAMRTVNPLAQGVLSLFALAADRRGLDELIALLRLPAVLARFGLTDPDVQAAHAALLGVGARWGADAADRTSSSVAEPHLGTWEDAVDRILLGVLSSNEHAIIDELSPWPDAWASRVELGRVAAAIQAVRAAIARFAQPRPLRDWVDLLAGEGQTRSDGVLASLFAAPEGDARSAPQVYSALRDLRALGAQLDSTPISHPVIAQWFAGRFEQNAVGFEGYPGSLTLTSMRQARSVASRVMIVLGADAMIFPRQSPPAAWDLVAASKRPTDLFARDEDRATFFDLIMGARDAFVVLFDGRDPTANTSRPAATPVADLVAATRSLLETEAGRPIKELAEKMLRVEHPIARHAPSAFRESGGAIWSYDARQAARAAEVQARRQQGRSTTQRGLFAIRPSKGESLALHGDRQVSGSIDADTIARMLQKPTEYQLRNLLGLSLRESDQLGDGGVLPLDFDEIDTFAARNIATILLNALQLTRRHASEWSQANPLATLVGRLAQVIADGADTDSIGGAKKAVADRIAEQFRAQHKMPVFEAAARATIETQVFSLSAVLQSWMGRDARPAPLRVDGDVDEITVVSRPSAESSEIFARVRDINFDARCAWYLSNSPIEVAALGAWVRLLLLELQHGHGEAWTVLYCGLEGREGLVRSSAVSLAFVADPTEREALAREALLSLSTLVHAASQRPLGLLRYASKAMSLVPFRFPPEPLLSALDAPDPDEAKSRMLTIVRALQGAGALRAEARTSSWYRPASWVDAWYGAANDDCCLFVWSTGDRDRASYTPQTARAWGELQPNLRALTADGDGDSSVLIAALASDSLPAFGLFTAASFATWLTSIPTALWSGLVDAAPLPSKHEDDDGDETLGLRESEREAWKKGEPKRAAGKVIAGFEKRFAAEQATDEAAEGGESEAE